MTKTYISSKATRDARPRSERLRGILGQHAVQSTGSVGGAFASLHTHPNKKDIDALSIDDNGYGYVTLSSVIQGETEEEWVENITTGKIKSGYADSAYDLAHDSPFIKALMSLIVPVDNNGNEIEYAQYEQAVALKAKLNLFSVGDISALGPNGNAGGPGGGISYDRLDTWADYSASKSGYVLSALLGYDLHTRVNAVASGMSSLAARVTALEEDGGSFDESMLSAYLKKTDAQTLYQPKGNYLTQHQSISHLLSKTDAQTLYQPKGNYLTQHQSISHLLSKTDAQTLYQPKGNYLTQHQSISHLLSKTDAQTLYQPKGNYLTQHQSLANYVTLDTVQTVTGTKIFTDIRLSGQPENVAMPFFLGIDAYAHGGSVKYITAANVANAIGVYTKSEADSRYVTLGTAQTITGVKTFSGEHKFVAAGLTYSDPWPSTACAVKVAGKMGVTDSVRALSFIKAGGNALQLLMADGSVRSLKTRTSVGPSDWTDQASADALVPTMSVLAFWNGRYNDSASNLQYCDRGRFGDIVTQSLSSMDSRYVNVSGDTMNGTLFLGGRTGQVGSDSAKAWLQWQGTVLSVNAQGAWLGSTGKVWHSDNDGSGSGLDADMLDGVHKDGFSSRKDLGYSPDAKVCYIILTHAYNGSVINGSGFHGMVTFSRGSSGSWNGKTAVYIVLGGQYNSNVSSYFKLGSSVDVSGVYRVVYNGTAYLALRMEVSSSQRIVIHGEISDYSVPCIVQESQVTNPTLINNTPGLGANASSASKLASSRSIWGQGFDGTGNVSGNMTGVGNINTAASPAGTIYVNNWLRTVGDCGWYSETYGGGWFMSDSVWIRNHNNKNLYMSTAIIRTDGQIQVGGNGDKFLVTSNGAVTAASNIISKADVIGLSTSDERLKHNISPVRNAVTRLRELGGFFSFDYDPDASECDKTDRIGLIYQKVHGPIAMRMKHKRDDGYGALNYIHPDYINLIGAGVLEVASEAEDLRAELSSLKKRVHRLENTSYIDPTYY